MVVSLFTSAHLRVHLDFLKIIDLFPFYFYEPHEMEVAFSQGHHQKYWGPLHSFRFSSAPPSEASQWLYQSPAIPQKCVVDQNF